MTSTRQPNKLNQPVKHFLTLLDLPPNTLHQLINRGLELKQQQYKGISHQYLPGKVLAMIFAKASTRTRIAFEVGMIQLGGQAIFLSAQDTQIGRGEPISDTARVLSGMVDGIMIRTFAHATVVELARYATVPVINGLTDQFHPCQLLADMMTYQEHRGSIQGKTVAWIGDGNNMCQSYINAAQQFAFKLRIACPEGYLPDSNLINTTQADILLTNDPFKAASAADLIVTDVWASMGQETEQQQRINAFSNYQVNRAIMAAAKPDALFMHCLPAHRGEEVSADVIDGTQSVVWDEAENRLHAQKALLEYLLQPN